MIKEKKYESEMSIKVFYKADGADATKILIESLLIAIKKEVEELCKKIS